MGILEGMGAHSQDSGWELDVAKGGAYVLIFQV
jgi:hypothetical protein